MPDAGRLRQVVLMHMPLGHRPAGDEVRAREREVLAAAAAVVTTSAWTRRRLAELYALPAERMPRGRARRGRLRPGPGRRGRRRAAVRRGRDAREGPRRAARRARHGGRPGLELHLHRQPGEGRRVRRRAAPPRREHGLGGRVRFPGPRTGAELDRAYAAADLLVLASHAETYGMVVTEALARGLPVLATDVGGVPEALGHGDDGTRPGLLVPPGDAAALGAALRRWLEDAGLRERLRRAARERRASAPVLGRDRRGRRPRAGARGGGARRADGGGAMSHFSRQGQPRVARAARAGRCCGTLRRARRAARAPSARGRSRGARPRRRQRRDGPLARAAAAAAAALGRPRPRRGPARARRARLRDAALGHHAPRSGRARRRRVRSRPRRCSTC